MGVLKQMQIEEIEREEKYRGRPANTDLLICELQQMIKEQQDALRNLRDSVAVATRLLRGAIQYGHNPYLDNETEFDEWLDDVHGYVRHHSARE